MDRVELIYSTGPAETLANQPMLQDLVEEFRVRDKSGLERASVSNLIFNLKSDSRNCSRNVTSDYPIAITSGSFNVMCKKSANRQEITRQRHISDTRRRFARF